jgi:hypothetical protein
MTKSTQPKPTADSHQDDQPFDTNKKATREDIELVLISIDSVMDAMKALADSIETTSSNEASLNAAYWLRKGEIITATAALREAYFATPKG